MALKDAVKTILNRNAFYRDGYRMLLRISIIQGVIIVLLVIGLVSAITMTQIRQVYFATTSDGRIINIVPMNDPYRSDAEVIAWAAATAQSVFRFDYRDYHERLQQISTSFTNTGWQSFQKALKDASIIEAVEARKLVVSLDIGAAPEIKNKFVKNGVYSWQIQFPITIRFDGNEPPQPIRTMLAMQVSRVSTLQNTDGISIEQWVTYNPGNK